MERVEDVCTMGNEVAVKEVNTQEFSVSLMTKGPLTKLLDGFNAFFHKSHINMAENFY